MDMTLPILYTKVEIHNDKTKLLQILVRNNGT
jgi:hypothetical protein